MYGLLNPKGQWPLYDEKTFKQGTEDISKALQEKYPNLSKDKAHKMAFDIMKEMNLGEAGKMGDWGTKQKTEKDQEKMKELQKQQEALLKEICERVKCDADLSEEEKFCPTEQK